MNWNAKDMDTYIQQKEYIDTLIVPLLKLETIPERMKSSSSSTEFLMYLTSFIEAQFKGRIMLLPPFSYTQSTDLVEMGNVLSVDLQKMQFKHVFYITTDPTWNTVEMDGQVIWLPPIPLENMDKQLKQSVIEDQLKQVLPKFTLKWSES
ncbi:YpiF family protein [Sporosarcina sp. FA9]|uniref:YpiF family protein n=1 Tax=Sporosarcina sp. FA9 TaxID=3413030 RepID=UPI003F65C793